MKMLKLKEEEKEDSFFDDSENNIDPLGEEISANEDSFTDSNFSTMSEMSSSSKSNRTICCGLKKPKKCIQISDRIEQIVDGENFQRFILFCIVINTLFLALEYY